MTGAGRGNCPGLGLSEGSSALRTDGGNLGRLASDWGGGGRTGGNERKVCQGLKRQFYSEDEVLQ